MDVLRTNPIDTVKVRGNKFEELKMKLFEEEFEKWMQNNNIVIEAGIDAISSYVKIEKSEIMNLFFQSTEELMKGFFRIVKREEGTAVEVFKNIKWEKHLTELFADYQTMIGLLASNSKENKLGKLGEKILKKKLPYLKIEKILDLFERRLDDENNDIKEFSTYRIKQAIIIAGNDAEVFLNDAKKYIDELKDEDDFKIFTKTQLQKIFFGKYGNKNKVKDVLNKYVDRIKKFDNTDNLLTPQYITKVFIVRGGNAEEYLNISKDSLQEIYNKVDNEMIKNIANYSEDSSVNDNVKGTIRQYLLREGTTRSIQEIEKRKNDFLAVLNGVDWKMFDAEVDTNSKNIKKVASDSKYNIPEKIQPSISAIFLKHNKTGNVAER
jgi:hypothetical protein